jgi:TPP-dependent trihydroxycyclohexane-1,2-dione (THcHDO) dehydratase
MKTRRMTMAQALIAFLKQQHVERDGREHAFFAGMLGIFGHGNVAGIGQALQENPDLYIGAKRAGGSAHRYGVCQGEQPAAHICVYVVDWAGRDEYDYRRGASDN